MTTEFDQRISLAIDGGHNILGRRKGRRESLGTERLLELAGFPIKLKKNGGIHVDLESNTLLRSVTVNSGPDIPLRLTEGVAQFAILGRDILRDAQLGGMELEEVLPLRYSHCEVAVLKPEDSPYEKPSDLNGLRVATSLEYLTVDFFKQYGSEVRIVRYTGKHEGAPRVGAAEVVVAIYDTGTTATENHLVKMATILESEAVLASTTTFLRERGSDSEVIRFVEMLKCGADKLQEELKRGSRRWWPVATAVSLLAAVMAINPLSASK